MTAASPDEVDRSHRRFLWGITLILFVGLWLWPLRSSLWTDELGTWWVIKDGVGDTVERAITFHGQSPLYYLIAWASRHVIGRSEIALRVPSLVAAVVATLLAFRIVRELVDDEAARLTVLAFVGLGGIAFAATDARPYALGLCMVVASTSLLVVWTRRGGAWFACWYALSAVTVVWAHYMLALAIPVQVAYLFVCMRRGTSRTTGRDVAVSGLVFAVGVAPLVAQLASLWGRRGSLAVPNVATPDELLRVIIPLTLLAGIGLGWLIARALGPVGFSRPEVDAGAPVLGVGGLLVPPLVLFVLSLATGVMLFAPRYYVVAAPAAAAGFGWAVSSFRPAQARRLMAVAFALVAVATGAGLLKNGEDWRGAISVAADTSEPNTPVLMHPAFVESAQRSWLDDPERRSYLLSPIAYYPLDADVILLPYVLDADAAAYLEEGVLPSIEEVDRFLMVTNYIDVPYTSWLDGRLAPDGWSHRVLAQRGEIQVIEFTRSAER